MVEHWNSVFLLEFPQKPTPRWFKFKEFLREVSPENTHSSVGKWDRERKRANTGRTVKPASTVEIGIYLIPLGSSGGQGMSCDRDDSTREAESPGLLIPSLLSTTGWDLLGVQAVNFLAPQPCLSAVLGAVDRGFGWPEKVHRQQDAGAGNWQWARCWRQ